MLRYGRELREEFWKIKLKFHNGNGIGDVSRMMSTSSLGEQVMEYNFTLREENMER